MTISNYLKNIRKKVLLSKINLFFWKIYALFVALFLAVLMLENVFYFSLETRQKILFSTIFAASSIILVYLIYILIAHNDVIKKYKLSTIALNIGEYSFTRKDMILNAFQLENSKNQTGSLELQKSFIDKVESQIVDVDQKPLLPIDRIVFWKKFALVTPPPPNFGFTVILGLPAKYFEIYFDQSLRDKTEAPPL